MKRLESWKVSEEFWKRVEPLVPKPQRSPDKVYRRRPGGGRKPQPPRQVFEAIMYVLRTGCQWKALPKSEFGSASAVHNYFLQWQEAGFFKALWQKGLMEYDEMEGIAWEWQSLDGALVKAPLARESVGRNPTDRGKKRGSKRSVLTDQKGVPLSIVISGANTHDVKLLAATIHGIVIERPWGEKDTKQHLCLDAGYVGEKAEQTVVGSGYVSHIRPRGEEIEQKRNNPGIEPKRWVVEVCHSWFNRFRKILVRYEKTDRSYLGLLMLAAAVIVFRKIRIRGQPNIIYG
ncbi:MAG: IS5 family transposase [Gammaproteobacteria bacterium]